VTFRNLFPVLLDPDERPGGGGEAPAPEAVVPSLPDSPWSSDLSGLGLEGDSLTRVDAYLRGTWQPRMTQFEQQLAQSANARELWDDFQADPRNTYLAVGAQLFGDEKVEALEKLLAQQEEAAQAQEAESPTDPRVAKMLEDYEARQQREAYERQLGAVKAANPELDEDLFHPFVIAAEGNFDDAVSRYNTYMGTVQAKYGQPQIEVPDAPTTLGIGDGDGGSVVPPTAERYDSIEAALEATLAEARGGSAPAVGTV
jgi:hypothetical protein